MSGISVSWSVTVLALALVSAVAVWAVLRQHHEQHRRALALRRRLKAELDAHQVRLERMRGRARVIGALDGRATISVRAILTRGCEQDLARLTALRAELARAAGGLEHAHGRKLPELNRELEAVGAKVADLGESLARREALWTVEAAPPDVSSDAQALPRRSVQRIA